jgi:seryl-tRNA synthetase
MTTVSDDLRRALAAEEAAEAKRARTALALAEAEEAAEDRPDDPALRREVEACRERFDAAAEAADEARRRRREIERSLPARVVDATHAARVREATP